MDWGTFPQWVTAITSTAWLTFSSGLLIAWWRRGVDLKKLALGDEADIRDHYAEELERVLARQHDCEAREEMLRERVRVLEDEVSGLKRIIADNSSDHLLILEGMLETKPSDIAPHAAASASRVKNIVKGKKK